jgi:signal peptidase I
MKFVRSLIEVVVIAGIAVAVTIVFRENFFNPYGISGTSMSPSFHDGDYVFVDQFSYRVRSAKRGEVIVFHGPASHGDDLLKRIIGLPGERVVVADSVVTVFNSENPEGFVLAESYLDPATVTPGKVDVTLGGDQYFVMGDNRSVSFDSRSWGPLDSELIVGKVALRIWPPETSKVFGAERY